MRYGRAGGGRSYAVRSATGRSPRLGYDGLTEFFEAAAGADDALLVWLD
ncbi:hypothetical protein [Streptomyces sp. NPDC056660]